MLAMPDTLGGLTRVATTAQAADAWGAEFTIVARCGVPIPGPTTDPCVTVDTLSSSVDWIIHEGDDAWLATTYGRSPALEVVVPKVRADEAIADLLADLTPAAALAPETTHACVGLGDV